MTEQSVAHRGDATAPGRFRLADEVDATIAFASRGVDAPAIASGTSPQASGRGEPSAEPGSRILGTDRGTTGACDETPAAG